MDELARWNSGEFSRPRTEQKRNPKCIQSSTVLKGPFESRISRIIEKDPRVVTREIDQCNARMFRRLLTFSQTTAEN